MYRRSADRQQLLGERRGFGAEAFDRRLGPLRLGVSMPISRTRSSTPSMITSTVSPSMTYVDDGIGFEDTGSGHGGRRLGGAECVTRRRHDEPSEGDHPIPHRALSIATPHSIQLDPFARRSGRTLTPTSTRKRGGWRRDWRMDVSARWSKPTIVGELVTLRPLDGDDVAAVWEMVNDPVGSDLTATTRRSSINKSSTGARHARRRTSDSIFAVVENATGKFAGEVVLNEYDPKTEAVSFRISLRGPGWYGRGLGAEATRMIVDMVSSRSVYARSRSRCSPATRRPSTTRSDSARYGGSTKTASRGLRCRSAVDCRRPAVCFTDVPGTDMTGRHRWTRHRDDSEAFDDGAGAETAAAAHRDQAVLAAGPLEFVHRLGQQERSRCRRAGDRARWHRRSGSSCRGRHRSPWPRRARPRRTPR